MARKVTPKKNAARPEEGRDDLSVIHPDVTLPIGDREITVREYGLVEGLRIRAQLRPFIADLQLLSDNGEFLVEDVLDIIGKHVDLVEVAIAQSASVDVAFVRGLGDADGDLLLNTWWSVCGPFFLRQILRRKLEQMRRQAHAGATSTSSSSQQASEPPSSLVDTPSDSSSSSTNA